MTAENTEDTEDTELVGVDAVEAQRGVALLEEAGAGERAVAVVEGMALVVFGDDERAGRQESAAVATEQAQSQGVLILRGPGGIEEDDIG